VFQDAMSALQAGWLSDAEREACKLGCQGIVSKRLGLIYRRGRSPHWIKVKNPKASAVKREAEEDWRR
jgi:bifunctional non-homologous end joining protein LigD